MTHALFRVEGANNPPLKPPPPITAYGYELGVQKLLLGKHIF